MYLSLYWCTLFVSSSWTNFANSKRCFSLSMARMFSQARCGPC